MTVKVQAAFDEILAANPELTFRDALVAVVARGLVQHEAAEDPAVHTWLHRMFQKSKIKANIDRVNKDP